MARKSSRVTIWVTMAVLGVILFVMNRKQRSTLQAYTSCSAPSGRGVEVPRSMAELIADVPEVLKAEPEAEAEAAPAPVPVPAPAPAPVPAYDMLDAGQTPITTRRNYPNY